MACYLNVQPSICKRKQVSCNQVSVPVFSNHFTCKLLCAFNKCASKLIEIHIVGKEFPRQHAGINSCTIGPRFFFFSANFFNMLKPDGSSRPSIYLKIGTVSSTWPLMVILREVFILFHLREISINLHLEELRNM